MYKKIIISLLIILLLSTMFLSKTFAIADIIKAGDNFVSKNGTNNVIDENKLGKVNSKIYNILLMCAIAIAVIYGSGLGIYYIISSAEGKAKIAETLVPYIIGCIVAFGAFGIWKLAIDAGNSVEEEINVATGTIIKLLKFS